MAARRKIREIEYSENACELYPYSYSCDLDKSSLFGYAILHISVTVMFYYFGQFPHILFSVTVIEICAQWCAEY